MARNTSHTHEEQAITKHDVRFTVLPRALFAELVGAFVLTFADAGTKMVATLTSNEVSVAGQAIVPGLVIPALIYALGSVSGAHFNPAVTLAFALRGVFRWRFVPLYWTAQLSASILAALALRRLFGDLEHLGATVPHAPIGVAFTLEVFASTFLVMVILGTATRHSTVGTQAALAVGATIAACSLLIKPLTGASMNPARSFGPALLGGALDSYWIYALAPVVGAVVAVALTFAVHGGQHAEETKVAHGEDRV